MNLVDEVHLLEELFEEIARTRLRCCHLEIWLERATQWSFTISD